MIELVYVDAVLHPLRPLRAILAVQVWMRVVGEDEIVTRVSQNLFKAKVFAADFFQDLLNGDAARWCTHRNAEDVSVEIVDRIFHFGSPSLIGEPKLPVFSCEYRKTDPSLHPR